MEDSTTPISNDMATLVDELTGVDGAADTIREIAKDPQAFLNAVHVPDDAGEYEDGLRAILARIPDGWGRWISCGKGWYPLVIATDAKLAAIDPDYVVHQVKEKFGGLRYYHQIHGDYKLGAEIEAEAERQSFTICEVCGEPGRVRDNGWIQTLCDTHDAQR
jgi:hypothetical protein